MRILLLPISLLYSIVLKIRHKLYDWNILKSTHFDIPTICVGNLSLGGTGKTPTVEYLIRLLRSDFRTATLSRGYGRETKGFVVATTQSGYKNIGDEPTQYSNKFDDIIVAVDEDRVDGVSKLMDSVTAPQVILLDDAFQHRKIAAGLNILLTEYKKPYPHDHLLPAGSLRDLKSSAQRADIIVISKSPAQMKKTEMDDLVKQLRPTNSQKVFFSYIEYEQLVPLNETAMRHNNTQPEAVLLFCGIADPTQLIEHLNRQHPHIESIIFADHHPYSENDIRSIVKRYDRLSYDNKIIVTTEKDMARLKNSAYLCQLESLPLYVQPIGIRFHKQDEFNKEIMRYVREDNSHR